LLRETRSAGNDIREGEAILEVAMDDDKDWSAECCMRGEIIDSNVTEGILPSLPPVELKGFQDPHV
jgi:hypothetical protein